VLLDGEFPSEARVTIGGYPLQTSNAHELNELNQPSSFVGPTANRARQITTQNCWPLQHSFAATMIPR